MNRDGAPECRECAPVAAGRRHPRGWRRLTSTGQVRVGVRVDVCVGVRVGIRVGVRVGIRDGVRVEVQGCDVFTFRNGKIAVKNSYRKQRTG